MIFCVHDKHDNVNFLLLREQRGGFHAINVQAGRVDQRNIDNAIVQQTLGLVPVVSSVYFEQREAIFIILYNRSKIPNGEPLKGVCILAIIDVLANNPMHFLQQQNEHGAAEWGLLPRFRHSALRQSPQQTEQCKAADQTADILDAAWHLQKCFCPHSVSIRLGTLCCAQTPYIPGLP